MTLSSFMMAICSIFVTAVSWWFVGVLFANQLSLSFTQHAVTEIGALVV